MNSIYVPTVAYVCEKRNEFESKFEKLEYSHKVLQTKIATVFLEYYDNENYCNKLKYEVDIRPIMALEKVKLKCGYLNTKGDIFEKHNFYTNGKITSLKNNLKYESHRYDKDDLNELLSIYNEEIEEEEKYVTINNLGTSLNMLREIYDDLQHSLKKIERHGEKVTDNVNRLKKFNIESKKQTNNENLNKYVEAYRSNL